MDIVTTYFINKIKKEFDTALYTIPETDKETFIDHLEQMAVSNRLEKPVGMPSELLPCPFCGLYPTLNFRPSRRGVSAEAFIRCGKMICKVNPKTIIVKTKEQAIKIWNSRTNQ